MKLFGVLAAILLVIGGPNWGLYGLSDPNLVVATAGSATAVPQYLCAAVGLAALFQVISLRPIQRRWNVSVARVN